LVNVIIINDQSLARYQVSDQEIKFIIEDLLKIYDNRNDEFPAINI